VSEERLIIDSPHQGAAQDWTPVDSPQPEFLKSDLGTGRQQQVLDVYLKRLMRAQKEQERVEKDLERK
jgi:hypothetical protein